MNETLKKLKERRSVVVGCRWSFLTGVSALVKSMDDVSDAIGYAEVALQYDAELRQIDVAIRRIEKESECTNL